MGSITLAGPGLGWFPDTLTVRAINRGIAVTYGQHSQLDLASVDAAVVAPGEATSLGLGGTNHPLANFIAPVAISQTLASIKCGIFGWCMDIGGIGVDATGTWMLRGVFSESATGGDGAAVNSTGVVDGAQLFAATTGILALGTTSADAKIIAFALEDDDDTTGFAECVVDGINGFGYTGDA